MAVKIKERGGKWWLIATLLAVAGCASSRPRPEPVARAVLPPHVVEVAEGLFSCERGYLIKQGRCIPFADIPPGPIMEISSIPSAGDGAAGGRLCPSGGCGSYVTPSYSTFVYSGFDSYGYGSWPGLGVYYGGLGARHCTPHVRRFRGGDFAFGGRAGSFAQERSFEGWKSSFPGATFRGRSFAVQRSPASGRFGSNRTRRGR